MRSDSAELLQDLRSLRVERRLSVRWVSRIFMVEPVRLKDSVGGVVDQKA